MRRRWSAAETSSTGTASLCTRVLHHAADADWLEVVNLKTPQGQQLILDQTAKLEQGCTVAVFLTGCFMLVGRLLRRPVVHRHLVIGYRDVHGNEGVTRIFGLRDEDAQIWRVTGVVRDL